MTVTHFGIRHHGPGCARSLRTALEELRPDIVLVEGPPEADPLLPLVADETMRPPVALLIYHPSLPRQAVFYPFATFSPEWQALLYATEHDIPARFCDLPQAIRLAQVPEESSPSLEMDTEPAEDQELIDDPIGLLAQAAGYSEGELWWEEEIERRRDARGMFEAIREAMGALRASIEHRADGLEAQREAWMRTVIRGTEKEGFKQIAVVCGAWHTPALSVDRNAREDAALLSGLPRVRVEATWIPWTYSRLSYASGYGAGIASPGWYHHLWTAPDRATTGWVARAAHLLRSERLDAPASGVIDGVRLAEALAALRERRAPGLGELREAIQTVLCSGEAMPMRLIQERLEVGDVMGTVPATAPTVPLQRDVTDLQRRLRLRPSETVMTLDLDLRKETDRERSLLLHRMRVLGIPWGELERSSDSGQFYRRGGTFHEIWRIQWQVEFPLLLIEKNVWGNTVLDAADAFLRHEAADADLPGLTERLHQATVAELPAVSHILDHLASRSATTTDIRLLMDALLPLARVARYGDVRGTSAERVWPVLRGIYERVLVALPSGCASLDDAAATGMLESLMRVKSAVDLLNEQEMRQEWGDVLESLTERDSTQPIIRGWCVRLLFESGRIEVSELERLASLSLSRGAGVREAAAWIEGLLRGPGIVLIHHDGLWLALDRWLQSLDAESFEQILPLLRRAFSQFAAPERRALGEKMRRLRADSQAGDARPSRDSDVVRERTALVIPVLSRILGLEVPQ